MIETKNRKTAIKTPTLQTLTAPRENADPI